MFSLAISGSHAQNLLVDGDFSTTTEILPYTGGQGPAGAWYYYLKTGTNAVPSVESGVCHFHVVTTDIEMHAIQLMQWGFPIIPGHTYRLTLDVKSDGYRMFGVNLVEDEGSWTSILGYDRYWQLATDYWQTLTFEFIAAQSFPWHKFSLEMGSEYGDLWFDNIMLEDLGKIPVLIGILGTSLNGWDTDVDMTTDDDITYTLKNYPLTSGYCKFRQDDSWTINWGDTAFPAGIAFRDGPNIPVYTSGNYDITFNRLTGEYKFTCVDQCAARVGIMGTEEYGWYNAAPMWSSDGIHYVLDNVRPSEGKLLFKVNDDKWMWGGGTFPDGIAVEGGPGIIVPYGNYSVSFNVETGEYHFTLPKLGILGSALSGWDTDVDLTTTDGIIFTLKELPLTDGLVKFRLNDSWDLNWGGWEFPSGYAWKSGPEISVPAGTYDVTFNLVTGEYLFQATTCPVAAIQCTWDYFAGSEPGLCGAYVWYPEVVPAPTCGGGGVTIVQTAGLPSGSFFPVGMTTNTFLLTNETGETAECSFNVMVYDWEPPVISDLSVEFDPFSPPNHKMTPVTLNYQVTDNCGSPTCEVYVYTSEPENGIGDGNTLVDTEVVDAHHLLLRAERTGLGEGRYFYIVLQCHDEYWNSDYRQVTLFVPHDNRDGGMIGLKSAGIFPVPEGDYSGLQLWPNPASDYFNLQIDGSTESDSRISVSDMTGRIVLARSITGPQTLQFGEELVPGSYIVRVTREGNSEVRKILKK